MAEVPDDHAADAHKQFTKDVRELTALLAAIRGRAPTEDEQRRKVELFERIADYHRDKPDDK